MQAMTFTAPPQAGQVSMSMPKTRFKALRPEPAPDLIPGHGGPALSRRWWFIGYLALLPLPRLAGVTKARCLLFGTIKSPGAILNSFKLARRVEGRTPGITPRDKFIWNEFGQL